MPHLDLTITLGNIIELGGIVVALFAIYHGVMQKFSSLESTLNNHADKLGEHGDRMERYEAGMLKLVGDVQRLVGRMDARSH